MLKWSPIYFIASNSKSKFLDIKFIYLKKIVSR